MSSKRVSARYLEISNEFEHLRKCKTHFSVIFIHFAFIIWFQMNGWMVWFDWLNCFILITFHHTFNTSHRLAQTHLNVAKLVTILKQKDGNRKSAVAGVWLKTKRWKFSNNSAIAVEFLKPTIDVRMFFNSSVRQTKNFAQIYYCIIYRYPSMPHSATKTDLLLQYNHKIVSFCSCWLIVSHESAFHDWYKF